MDGDRRPRPDQPGGIDRGGGIEPLRAARRTPTADGQQRDIDMPGQPRHLRVQRGVAGEVHVGRPFDEIADRARGGSQQPPAVTGGQRPDPDTAKVEPFVGGDLADRVPGDGRRRAQAARDDEQRVAGQASQRRAVEMVGMGVRDQDRVDRAEGVGVGRRAQPAKRPDAGAQDRVGQDAQAVELDEQRGVTDLGQAESIGHAVRRDAGQAAERTRPGRRGGLVDRAASARR